MIQWNSWKLGAFISFLIRENCRGLAPAIFRGTPGNWGHPYFQLLEKSREKLGGIHNVIYKFTYLPIFGRVVGNRLQSEKMYPMRVYSKGNRVLGRTNLSLGQFFPFLDHQPCLALLRLADNMLMIAESENLSLGKFCSSSNTFLSPIP